MKQGRKSSGGKYKKPKKKKLSGRPRQERKTRLGEKKAKIIRTRGGNKKEVLLKDNYANVISNKKAKKVKIKTVLETPSNVFLARQNVLVKGAIIETELGKARITNRPSQEGCIQAVIIN